MFGKHFASMYEGSMVGAGSHVFAMMGYVIAHQRPDPVVGGQVRLNPGILATIFGEPELKVQQAIDYLCAPDPKSTTPDEEGRRLVKIGQFDYRVVNAAKYLAIRNEEERREANRIRQAKHRKKPKKHNKSAPSARERAFVAAAENGDVVEQERLTGTEREVSDPPA